MRLIWTIIIILHSSLCTILNAQADFYASDTEGCTPTEITFYLDPATVRMDTIATVEWDFLGTGEFITSSVSDSMVFTYEDPDTFSVLCRITNNDGEVFPIEKTDYIVVHQTVLADFRYERTRDGYTYYFIPTDPIIEESTDFYYEWSYFDLSDGTQIRTKVDRVTSENHELAIDTITFPDTGNYSARLDISSVLGCSNRNDPVFIVVRDEILIPNIFFPDEFAHYVIDPNDPGMLLSFQLFSRNGVLIFSQEAPIINWDGRTNSGQELNTGVYYYVLEAKQGDPDKLYTKNGFIHVFRK